MFCNQLTHILHDLQWASVNVTCFTVSYHKHATVHILCELAQMLHVWQWTSTHFTCFIVG